MTTPQPWACRACLTEQPVIDGTLCHYVCEPCRVRFEQTQERIAALDAREKAAFDFAWVRAISLCGSYWPDGIDQKARAWSDYKAAREQRV